MHIYVTTPYRGTDIEKNLKSHKEMGKILYDAGHHAFLPLLYHYALTEFPDSYSDWQKVMFPWLQKCDAILAIGDSEGVREEIEHAKKCGLLIYSSVDELLR